MTKHSKVTIVYKKVIAKQGGGGSQKKARTRNRPRPPRKRW